MLKNAIDELPQTYSVAMTERLADAYDRDGQHQVGAALLEQMRQGGDNRMSLLRRIGLLYQETDNANKAASYFGLMQSMYPTQYEGSMRLCYLYLQLFEDGKDNSEVKSVYNQALALYEARPEGSKEDPEMLQLKTIMENPGSGGAQKNQTAVSSANGYTVGSTVQFGDYDWRVLAVDGNKALLITQYIIDERNYHSEWVDVTWETCDLRAYLNGEFYNSFSSSDRAKIVQVKNPNPDPRNNETNGGNDTMDHVFLLSSEEADLYFPRGDRQRQAFKTNGSYTDSWWLRTPGKTNEYAAYVYSGGDISKSGNYVDTNGGSGIGVRPAIWINI